jgi:hypothetical protein
VALGYKKYLSKQMTLFGIIIGKYYVPFCYCGLHVDLSYEIPHQRGDVRFLRLKSYIDPLDVELRYQVTELCWNSPSLVIKSLIQSIEINLDMESTYRGGMPYICTITFGVFCAM